MGTFTQQVKALVWRNWLLKVRSKGYTIMEVVTPIYMLIILVLIKRFSVPPLEPAVTDFQTNPLTMFAKPGLLYVHDISSEVRSIMDIVQQSEQFTTVYFSNLTSMETTYESLANQSEVVAGLVFDVDPASLIFNYSIRVPNEQIPDGQKFDWRAVQKACRNPNGLFKDGCKANDYLWSGFVDLQTRIDTAIIKLYGNQSDFVRPDIGVKLFPKFLYAADSLQIRIMSSLYMVMSFFSFVGSLTSIIVTEKEKKIKETMRIMGLMDSAFWTGWGIIYFIEALIICVVMTLIALAASFYNQGNLFIFFLLIFLFAMSIITFAFAISTFFSKAKSAGGISVLLQLVSGVASMAVIVTKTMGPSGLPVSAVPAAAQWVLCLLSPMALALGIEWSLYLDVSVAGGANFGDNMYIGQLPMYAPILMLAVDTVLYGLLAVWLDSVVPNEYGQARPLWYCCLPSFWKPKEKSDVQIDQLFSTSDQVGYDNPALDVDGYQMEPVPPSMANKNVMRINNIKRKFKVKEDGKVIEKFVVNGISLDIYEGQITALLGHNGAGKTTLINMLTGLIQPTKGNASIFGLDVSDTNDMVHIRKFTGVCPQENVLFETLTPREHLYVYAMLAGLPKESIQKQIEQSLDEVDLTDKGNSLAKDLSGGQKRKLSLAMALIGDPKVIFLDEPTAGMDPYSRRHVWSVLKNRRPGRVIVLTTHFMDEADILADRKAVISKGQLKCVGSSLFLKNKFGAGYHLNMVVNPGQCNTENVGAFIHQNMPSAGEGRLHGMELDFTLPNEDVDKFAGLFSQLEEKDNNNRSLSDKMGIDSYGVSMTTLEEVFLKLEEDEENAAREKELEKNGEAPQRERANTDKSVSIQEQNGGNTTTVEFRESPFDASKTYPVLKDDNKLIKQRFWSLLKIRVLIQIRGGGFIFRLITPLFLSLLAIILYKYVMVVNVPPPAAPYHRNLDAHDYAQSTSSADKPTMMFHSAVDFGSTPPYNIPNYPSFKFGIYSQGFENTSNFNATSDLLGVAPHYLGYNIHKYSVNTSVIPNELLDSNITVYYNDSAMHSLPAALNVLFNGILRSSVTLPSQGGSYSLDSARIQTTSYPWPAKVRNQPFYYGVFILVLIVGMAMNFTAMGAATELVKDREIKARGQLKTAGISHNMYISSTLFADATQIYIIAVVLIIMMLALQPPGLDSGGAIFCMVVMLLLFVPYLNLFFVYIFSYMFDKFETAQSILPNAVIWIAMMPFMVTGLLGLAGGTVQIQQITLILHIVFCIIDPIYIPYGSINSILSVHTNHVFKYGNAPVPFSAYFVWDAGIIIVLICSVVHVSWMFFLWRYLDQRATSGDTRVSTGCCGKTSRIHNNGENNDILDDEDEDVANERKRLLAMDYSTSAQTPVAKVLNLRKEFEKKGDKSKVMVAVKNVSFAVMPGEVLGLLGPNGAGKTTTLNMVIAEVTPDKGKVTAGGYDVHSSMSEAFGVMGYCPQHDALWEHITAQEHIECYSAVRGIPIDDARSVANFYMSELAIEEHKDKKAKDCSGGTKRKLSYAMSMLGEPKIVLLDEPSTGMDPKSKRFLWDTITKSFEGSSRGAILTTHYMEEADALCNRISIMVNGRMECIGSSQHLKGKYGSGYVLEVKVVGSDDRPEELQANMKAASDYITSLFPGAERAEYFSDWMTYKIPQDTVHSLGATFQALEDGKRSYNFETYSFSQCTLEQVFIQFAKVQDEKDEDEESAAIKRQTSLVNRSQSLLSGHSTDL